MPGHIDRECPMCGKNRVCGIQEAERAFPRFGNSEWGATSMIEDADKVCSFCFSVRLEATGEWRRMKSVNSRAWDLAQASSSKDVDEYEEILQAGDDSGKYSSGPYDGSDAAGAGSRAGVDPDADRETVGGAEW